MASDGDDIQPVQRKPSETTEERPSYSPDGRYLVYSEYGAGVEPDIYVVEVDQPARPPHPTRPWTPSQHGSPAASFARVKRQPGPTPSPCWEPRGFVPDYPEQPDESERDSRATPSPHVRRLRRDPACPA